MHMINRDSPEPYYYQLYTILRQSITSGQLKPGDMHPTEAELLETYQVSRATVRQALEMLVSDGLIFRQRGRGTFVSRPTVEKELNRIVSFTEDMERLGFTARTQILDAQLQPADDSLAATLDVAVGDEVAYLKRLRLADDEPMGLENSMLVHRYCPGILEQYEPHHSLRALLRDEYGVILASATQKIRSVTADQATSAALGIDLGAALLYIERISYTDGNAPIELLKMFHRGDRYTLYNELKA